MNQAPDPNALRPGHGELTETARRSRRWGTGLLIVGVLGLAVVGIAACDSLPGAVDALQVGDCVDEPAGDATITEVQHRPCNQPHDGEVFAVLTHPAGPDEAYPVVSGFDDYIQDTCIPLWETYTARTWATDKELDIGYLHPTISGWGEGDRGFSCYTTKYGGGKLIASVKNIGASPLPVASPAGS